MSTTHTGPRLAVREFGDPSGEPLLFFHGWPGSGAQAVLLDVAAKEHGFRVIAPDRPGIGESPAQPGRALLDWPPLAAALADAFGIGEFSVLGVSGGGPYALACAWALPGRVKRVSVVCGAPPIAELAGTSALHAGYRALLWIFRRRPAAVLALFRLARPLMLHPRAAEFLRPLRIVLPRADAAALDEPAHFATVFDCQREAFADARGLFDDAALYAQPWGFAPEEIRVPVSLWHGGDDANFHFSTAEAMARRIPGATLRIVAGEGHFSLPIRRAGEILAATK